MKLALNPVIPLPLSLIRFLTYSFGSTWVFYVLLLCVLALHLFPTIALGFAIYGHHFGPISQVPHILSYFNLKPHLKPDQVRAELKEVSWGKGQCFKKKRQHFSK